MNISMTTFSLIFALDAIAILIELWRISSRLERIADALEKHNPHS